jgi:hypothetical protein
MSFERHYPNRKEGRQPYYPRAAWHFRACRFGGCCPWCLTTRDRPSVVRSVQELEPDRRIIGAVHGRGASPRTNRFEPLPGGMPSAIQST